MAKNGPKWPKWPFGPFLAILGHFLGPVGPKWSKNRFFHKSIKCRGNYTGTIQKRFGTISNGFGDQKIENCSGGIQYHSNKNGQIFALIKKIFHVQTIEFGMDFKHLLFFDEIMLIDCLEIALIIIRIYSIYIININV